jgi:hypothetical protein
MSADDIYLGCHNYLGGGILRHDIIQPDNSPMRTVQDVPGAIRKEHILQDTLQLLPPTVMVEWLTHLLCIREVPGLNIGPETGYPEVFVFSSVPRKCRDSALN